jgi:hypothetical protein
MGMSFTIAAGLLQRSHSLVQRGTHYHIFLLSHIRDSSNFEGQSGPATGCLQESAALATVLSRFVSTRTFTELLPSNGRLTVTSLSRLSDFMSQYAISA